MEVGRGNGASVKCVGQENARRHQCTDLQDTTSPLATCTQHSLHYERTTEVVTLSSTNIVLLLLLLYESSCVIGMLIQFLARCVLMSVRGMLRQGSPPTILCKHGGGKSIRRSADRGRGLLSSVEGLQSDCDLSEVSVT